MTIDPLAAILNTPVLFGLKAQGHIPTIEKMLAEGANWDAIADKIKWCPRTAREHYERYAQDQEASTLNDSRIEPMTVLAACVGLLEQMVKTVPEWNTPLSNDIHNVIRRANKFLLSAPGRK